MSGAARGLGWAAAAALALGCGGGEDAAGEGAAADGEDVPGAVGGVPVEPSDAPVGEEGDPGEPPPAGGADAPPPGSGGPSGAAEPPAAGGGTPAGGAGGGAAAEGDTLTVSGTVRLTGTAEAPLLMLRSAGQTWLLSGEAMDELGRLDGATVRVTGRAGAEAARARSLSVTSYVLDSIGGDAPFVGVVEHAEDGQPVLATDAGTLRLAGAGGLADLAGARVWVLGARSGDALSVGSYGVIRPPG